MLCDLPRSARSVRHAHCVGMGSGWCCVEVGNLDGRTPKQTVVHQAYQFHLGRLVRCGVREG